jgi:hypothetical protein
MGAVEKDADAVRFLDHALAELREPAVGPVEAAIRELVRRVIGEKELPEAEPRRCLDPVELPAHEIAALGGEDESRSSFPLRPPDVLDPVGHEEVLVLPREAMPLHEVLDDVVESVMRTAGGDCIGGDAVAVGLVELRVAPDLHRGVDEEEGRVSIENAMKSAVLHVVNDTTSPVIDSVLEESPCLRCCF